MSDAILIAEEGSDYTREKANEHIFVKTLFQDRQPEAQYLRLSVIEIC